MGNNVGTNVPSNTPWSTALLTLLRAPLTPDNYRFLNAWAIREHGTATSLYANNPFFTSAGGSGQAGPFLSHTLPLIPDSAFPGGKNTAGIPQYQDINQGVLATFWTLTQYPAIVGALKSGHPQQFAGSANLNRELSTWSGGGYSSLPFSSAPATPVGPGLDAPIEGTTANDFWSGKGGAAVIGAIAGTGVFAAGAASGAGVGAGATKVAEAGAAAAGGVALVELVKRYAVRAFELVTGVVLMLAGLYLLAGRVGLAAPSPPGPVGAVAAAAA